MTSNKIRHITFSSKGGAGKVAQVLVDGQLDRNFNSKLEVLTDGGVGSVALSNPNVLASALFDFGIVRNDLKTPLFSLYRRGGHNWVNDLEIDADEILHLHWVVGFFGGHRLRSLLTANNCVWTLHDMWPFTGGCHHSIECEGFMVECSNCPQVRSVFHGAVENSLRSKVSMISEFKNLVIVAPSKWIGEKARKSEAFKGRRIEVIPNPVDTDKFKQHNREEARKHFGIPETSFVIGCVAVNLLDPQKNIKDLIDRVGVFSRIFSNRRFVILAIGGGELKSAEVEIIQTGLVDGYKEMVMAYKAMDVYVTLSLSENFPLTLIEAASAGVPAICLDRGGMPEIVEDGETGIVISHPSEFLSALQQLYEDQFLLKSMSSNAISNARKLFSINSVVEKYDNVYKSFDKTSL